MIKLIIAVVLVLLSSNAYAYKKGSACDADCASCHRLTPKDATQIIKGIDPGAVITEVKSAPVKGLYQLTAKKDGSSGTIFLDFGKKYVVQGAMIDIRNKKNAVPPPKQSDSEDKKSISVSKISLKNALVMGNKNGRKKMYVFSDPECPYCGKLHDELNKLVKEDKDLKVYIILFGLDMHPNAGWKTQSILCRSKDNMQDAIRLLEASYDKKDVKKFDCKENYAEENKRLARELQMGATPSMVLPDGKVVMGYKTKEELKAILKGK